MALHWPNTDISARSAYIYLNRVQSCKLFKEKVIVGCNVPAGRLDPLLMPW